MRKEYIIIICADIHKDIYQSLSNIGIHPDDIQDDGIEGRIKGFSIYRRFNIEFSRKRDCIRFARKIFKAKIDGVLTILAGYYYMPWYEVHNDQFSF